MRRLIEPVLKTIQNSLVIKAFGTCFLAVHLPLIAIIGYLLIAEAPTLGPVLLVSLAATLIGTVLSIRIFYVLLRPLDRILAAIDAYGARTEIIHLDIRRGDEVGRIATGVEQLVARLDETLGGLRRQATTDALTAIGNRRWLQDEAGPAFARAARERTKVSVCLFDLDHFKQINDRHGHAVGDMVLMAVAEIARQKLRPYDLLARWGGEEFCFLIGGLQQAQLILLTERLRHAIASAQIGPLPAGTVTASFGIASGDPAVADFATLTRAADKALYAAKGAGRNRVVASAQEIRDPAPFRRADQRIPSSGPG